MTAGAASLPGLAGTLFDGGVRIVASTGSTIDDCRALADDDAPEGTVVLARRQTQGRGQRTNAWFSPEGGLYVSALLRPAVPTSTLSALPLLVGVAAADAVREELGVEVFLKPPNDLLVPVGGTWRKLGGLLVDTAVQGATVRHAIVSLGLNCRLPSGLPPELYALATSLDRIGASAGPDEVATSFLLRLARWRDLMDDPSAAWVAEAARRHASLARNVVAGAKVDAA